MSASHLSIIILCIPHPVEEHNPQLALKGTTANTAESKRTSLFPLLKVNSTAETHRWCLDYVLLQRLRQSLDQREHLSLYFKSMPPALPNSYSRRNSDEIKRDRFWNSLRDLFSNSPSEFLARGLFFLCP